MNSSYSIKLIWDYINGNYIDNIDELENDYKFMMDVINFTRDKKMYNLCSDEIKNNYEFVIFMINLFKDDLDFILDVANQYLNCTSSDNECVKDLIFVMCDILDNYKDDEKYWMYFVKRAAIVTCDRIMINSIIAEEDDLNIKKQFGLGFILFLNSEYGKSSSMIKYVANILLDEIFYESNNLSIEDLVHKRFSSLDKLDRFGIKNFIFSYVGEYDSYLATYLSVNMDMISGIEKRIIYVRNNWNRYLKRNLIRKNEIFIQETLHLIEEYNSIFSYEQICKYINTLNIIPVRLDLECEEEIEIIDFKTINLNDYTCVKKIVELAKELYLSPVIDSSVKYSKESVGKKNKILKFIPKRIEDKKNN